MKAESRSQGPVLHSPALRDEGGFTLVEILTVLAIIAMLAALTLGVGGYARRKAGSSRAKAEIAAMETALESFKNDNGTYPITGSTTPATTVSRPLDATVAQHYGNSTFLYTVLAGGPNYPKTYMTFKPNQIQVPSGTITNIVDPFGTPYNYYCRPSAGDQINSVTFDLWSYGPDRNSSVAADKIDDITNWKQ